MNTQQPLLIIGGGGHGKVVAETAEAAGFKIHGFLDDNTPSLVQFLGIPRLGTISGWTKSLREVQFIVAMGNNDIRCSIFERFSKLMPAAIVIHPSAMVSPSSSVERGTVVLAGAVINAGAKIGQNAIINSLSLVDHDSIISDHCHIAQGTIIGSEVRVGEGVLTQLGQHIPSRSSI
jgi:sugar O-acyltransferase (sialic acid O-acetyltransferase NeuD family)